MKNYLKSAVLFALAVIVAAAAVSCSDKSGAPNGMKAASSDKNEYNMYVPTGWTVDMSTGVVSAFVSDNDTSNVSVQSMELDNSDMTLDEYWAKYEGDFKSLFPDIEYVSQENTVLGGLAAKKYVYTATVTGAKYQFMQVVTLRIGRAYIFTYTAHTEKYDSHIDAVEQILTNFSFK